MKFQALMLALWLLCPVSGIQVIPHAPQHPYLSITYVTNDPEVPETGKMMNFYTYDVGSNTLKKQAAIPYHSQYALGAVDLKRNKVYYTNREINEIGNADHIYEYDIASKQSVCLESENRAYNDIAVVGDKLLVSAIRAGNNPAVFDLNTRQFTYLHEKKGYEESRYACSPPIPLGYNLNTQKFLYVYVEQERLYDKQYRSGENQSTIPYHIALMDINLEHQQTYTFYEEEVQYATQISENQILCQTTDGPHGTGNRKAYLLDMSTQQLTQLDAMPMPKMASVMDCITIDNGKTFYVAGVSTDGTSGVFRYDTAQDLVEPILLDDAQGGHFVNFTMSAY